MERLYIPCPVNNEGCPLYPECYEDKHHLYSHKLGRQAIAHAQSEAEATTIKRFIANPKNHVRSCRNIHRTVLDRLPIPLPPIEYMREFNGT